mmetsp:Transcript_10523/g.29949  ORF Transcript_10523/g.29949 Transcript_10523/m.29949 type:complete len:534 (+) Transcript_10523:106-1707(+)
MHLCAKAMGQRPSIALTLLSLACTAAGLIAFAAAARPSDYSVLQLYNRRDGDGVPAVSVKSSLGRTVDALADRVGFLPGWGEPHFPMYSGYVTVDAAAERALFYVLAEASLGRETAPLLLWLNGGPGCSSLGGGFLSELGPYYPRREGGQLKSNPYSWHRNANVLFLESPAFVGFSYSNTSSDSAVGDERTAQDAYHFLLAFMGRFPELADRPLWLSGESYGGHYVPQLAWAITEGNEAGGNPRLNLKGFLAGNPLTDTEMDNDGAIEFWYSHAIISTETAQGIRQYCNFSSDGPFRSDFGEDDEKCDEFIDQSTVEMGNINIYDIFADVCLKGQQRVASQTGRAAMMARGGRRRRPGQQLLGFRQALLGSTLRDDEYDPCVDNEVEDYFNNPEVQVAIHANVSGRLPYRWTDCAPDRQLQYSAEDVMVSMIPLYEKLVRTEPGLSILVYSGDIDAILPVTGTRKWVEALGLKETSRYRPWTSSIDGQVAGWTKSFSNGLTFASVRGAGHMVPYTQPQRAFDMVSKFIQGQPL